MKFFWVTVPKPLEHAVSSCRKHFTSAAIFSALVNVLFLAPTIYMMQIYDRVVPTNGTTSLFWLTVIVGLALVTLAMLDAVRGRLMMRASLRLNQMMAGDVLNRLMARRTVKSGEPTTAQAIREFDTLRQAVGGQAFMALFDIPWTPIYFIVAFLIHPLLGILIFIGAAILLALALINARATRQSNEASIEANASAYSAQEAALSQAEIIRALGMRGAVVRRQLAEREEGLKHSVTSQFSATKYNSIVKFARMFMQSLSLGLGAWLAIQGQISIGAIIAASVLLSRALQPIEVLVRVWPTITQARQAAESLEHLFDSTDDILQETMKMPTPTGRITMNSVSVSNPEGTAKMLDGVTLSMEPGEIVGLIGPSGAGKTTLVRAIVGAVQPEEGEIRIDGVSYLDWEPDQMARHIGYLPQETALLQGTIKENISRFEAYRGGNEEAVDEKVINAAQLAGVHDMILHIPDSYDAKIGNGGAGLSRGQAQRIGLARALYDDPVLLVLDEPSSALDAIGEQALIMATNHAKKRGAAVMIVAHRGTVLKDADRIAVMRNGTIERSGPRDTILEDLKTAAANANVVSMNRKNNMHNLSNISTEAPNEPNADVIGLDEPMKEIRLGAIIAGIFFIGFLGWAAFIPLDSGAIANGVVAVSGSRQAVQHRDGGIVTALEVAEGQTVKKGDILLQISASELIASERGMKSEVYALLARKSRLLAERDGLAVVAQPPEFSDLEGEDLALGQAALRAQRQLFTARRKSIVTERGMLRQRMRQYSQQIGGYGAQITSKKEQSRLIAEELEGLRSLHGRGFVATNRLRAVERAAAQLEGDRGSLQADIARASEAIGEAELQTVALDRQLIEEVNTELDGANIRLDALQPKLSAIREQIGRAMVRAPAGGRVVGLNTFTVGGVVASGDILMEIVPQDRKLVVEAKASPIDADDLRPGLATQVRFSGIQERNLPVLNGKITKVSADTLLDTITGENYFQIEVIVPPQELDKIAQVREGGGISAGMPAEVMVPLRKRSALSYLLEPLTQALWRAGREH